MHRVARCLLHHAARARAAAALGVQRRANLTRCAPRAASSLARAQRRRWTWTGATTRRSPRAPRTSRCSTWSWATPSPRAHGWGTRRRSTPSGCARALLRCCQWAKAGVVARLAHLHQRAQGMGEAVGLCGQPVAGSARVRAGAADAERDRAAPSGPSDAPPPPLGSGVIQCLPAVCACGWALRALHARAAHPTMCRPPTPPNACAVGPERVAVRVVLGRPVGVRVVAGPGPARAHVCRELAAGAQEPGVHLEVSGAAPRAFWGASLGAFRARRGWAAEPGLHLEVWRGLVAAGLAVRSRCDDVFGARCARRVCRWRPAGPGSANPSQSPLLATVSFDNTVKLWDVERGVCAHTLQGHTQVRGRVGGGLGGSGWGFGASRFGRRIWWGSAVHRARAQPFAVRPGRPLCARRAEGMYGALLGTC